MSSLLYNSRRAARVFLSLSLSTFAFAQDPPPLPNTLGKKTVLIGGVAFAEGPTFDSKGNFYFTNYMKRGTVGRMTPDGTVSIWFTLDRGAPNGMRVDRQDRVLVADQDGGRLLRIDATGSRMEVLADAFEGRPLNGPNDVIVDREGNIYFTDPKGSSAQKRVGALYRLRTDGKLERLLTGLAFPNGLALTPDGRSLYYVESYLSRLSAFDVGPNGEVTNHRALAQFLPHPLDGIAFDEHSRLWITHYSAKSIEVVSRDGEFLKSYADVGEYVSNLCFRAGKLYVTLTGSQTVHVYDVGLNGPSNN